MPDKPEPSLENTLQEILDMGNSPIESDQQRAMLRALCMVVWQLSRIADELFEGLT